jgi:hypothetical protein
MLIAHERMSLRGMKSRNECDRSARALRRGVTDNIVPNASAAPYVFRRRIPWRLTIEPHHPPHAAARKMDRISAQENRGCGLFNMTRSPKAIRGRRKKKKRSGLQSACDELIDKGAFITGE